MGERRGRRRWEENAVEEKGSWLDIQLHSLGRGMRGRSSQDQDEEYVFFFRGATRT